MDKINLINGVFEKYNDLDFGANILLAGIENQDLTKLPTNTSDFWKHKIQYNQKEVSGKSCVLHSGLGILSNYFNETFILETRKSLWELAKKEYKASDEYGMYLSDGVDMIRKRWNNSNSGSDKELYTFLIETGSQLFFDLLNKGYMAQSGFRGNKDYNNDKNDDGILGNTITKLDNTTYGHCIYFVKGENKIVEATIVDSFLGINKFNVYGIVNLKKLVENNVFFKYSYFYIPKKYFKFQLNPKQKQIIEYLIKLNSMAWNNIEHQELRNKLKDMNDFLRANF